VTYSEWDDTPWSGSPPSALVPAKSNNQLVVASLKAVTDVTPWSRGPALSTLRTTPQQKAESYLRAYRVGWFYKAESKISADIAGLKVQVMPEGADGDNEQAIVPPDLDIPFEALNPVDQFLRLMEKPNPKQTGRQLRQKTQIRRDMAGAAFWYLEGGAGGATPTAIYGISPARMWPAYDRTGARIGWVMDRDAPSGGVPFDDDEIIAFVNQGPEDTYDPVGVVEAVFAHVSLGERIAVHAADMLATGGRLAGMLWPKDRALDEDEYRDVQRAWRNVASDPNAARRLLVFPEPMEWAQGAASPREIGIPELAALSRDEILTAFPISPYMLGVPMKGGGLDNGGASRREEKATYWEETIHPRVEDFEEDIQVNLVSRYEALMGETFDFEVKEPNLDDAASLIEKAGAYRALIAIGGNPDAAWEHVGLDDLKWDGLPALLDPAKQLEMQQQAQKPDTAQGSRVVVRDQDPRDTTAVQQTLVGKARDDLVGQELPGFRGRMHEFLVDQRARVVARLRNQKGKGKASVPDGWWDTDAEDAALRAALDDPYKRLARGAMQAVANSMDRVVMPKRLDRVLEQALKAAGSRISGINEVTRQAIAEQLTEGVRRGYSIDQLVRGVPDENFVGVQNAPLKNGIPAFDEYRAELIARTETMNAYNDAALRGYGSFGVKEVLAIDGDKDAECEQRDGRVYTIDDALGVSDHPNGTLDWAPV